MKRLLYILLVVSFFACDTKEGYIDTGVSNGIHNYSMYEYFKTDSYNWDTTRLVIERAGLIDLFDGGDSEYEQITFFGPTNYSILRWMLQQSPRYEKVEDIPVEICREYILKHVVKNKYLKADIAFRNPSYLINDPEQDGGTKLTCVQGNKVIAYTERDAYQGIENAGAIVLNLYSIDKSTKVPMASPDIQTTNGVVHALNYNYTFGQI